MKNVSGVSAYRRHSSRDKAFIEMGGKRIYLPGKYNSPESRSAYQEYARGKSMPSRDCATVSALVAAYLDYCQITFVKGEYDNTRSSLKKLINHSGVLMLEEFGPRRLKLFRDALAKDGTSRSHCDKVVGRVKKMFKWAASEEIIKPAAYQALTTLPPMKRGEARESSPRRPVRYSQVRAVMKAASPKIADMIRFQWIVGCRPGEVCAMRWEDIDMSQSPWRWVPSTHKNRWRGKKLEMFLGPMAQAVLLRWQGKGRNGYVFSPDLARNGNSTGYYVEKTYANIIEDLCVKLGVEHWTPHQIRHARATRIRDRHGIEAVTAALGMSSIDTAQIYAERSRRIAKRLAK